MMGRITSYHITAVHHKIDAGGLEDISRGGSTHASLLLSAFLCTSFCAYDFLTVRYARAIL